MGTTYYVSSLAGGSGTGTLGSPWTLAQANAASLSAGDEVRIMADGVYSIASGLTFTQGGAPGAKIKWHGANASGAVDGTKATIQATAGSMTMLTFNGDNTRIRYLVADGNNQTSVSGFTTGSSYALLVQCKAMNCTAYGIAWGGYGPISRCEATGCSGTAAISASSALFCEAYNNKTNGFALAAGQSAIFCSAYINTTTGAVGGGGPMAGFACTSVGYTCDHCIAYKNGSAGFDLTGNFAYAGYLSNCVAEGNGGEGFATAGAADVLLLNCAGYGNASGNYNATNIPAANVTGFVNNTTGTFFVNGDAGNFAPNTTANQGLLLKAAGYPGLMPRGTTTSYLDIGIQHQDSGGVSSTGVSAARIMGGL